MPDSSLIDAALQATLSGDATLSAILTDGWFFDEAKPGAERFGIISLVSESDVAVFGGRAYEDALYLVEARILGTSGTDGKTAAARIDVLLDGQTLTVAGYTCMAVFRESRIRITEADEIDLAIRWQRRGGHYRVQMSM